MGGMPIRVGAGIGIIIRDHLGKPISSTWKTCTDYSSAEEADLMVVFEGLRLMEIKCNGPGILECDSANVVLALQAPARNRSNIWSVLVESHAILRGRSNF
jgi:hypothetical protein